MLAWIAGNIGTILILAALIASVTAITVGLLRDKKRGKSSCGCGCANCAMNGSCHSNKPLEFSNKNG